MGALDPIAGFGVTFRTMFRKTFTQKYRCAPKVTAPRFHGRHQLNRWPDGLEKCVGCELCAWACPADAIYVEGAQNTDERALLPRVSATAASTRSTTCAASCAGCASRPAQPGADHDQRVRARRRLAGQVDLREEGPAGPAAAGHGDAAA